MSHHETGHEHDVDARPLGRAITDLREPVPVRAEWRASLLHRVAALPIPSPQEPVARVWRFRPLAMAAAGLVCALAGAGATALFFTVRSNRFAATDDLATLTSSMPLPGERSGHPPVRFVFVAPYASRVALVGDFNAWNPSATPMRRSPDGRAWLIDVPLAPGRHVYSFVVDGDLAADPAAPRSGDDDFGMPSSVVVVGDRGPRT